MGSEKIISEIKKLVPACFDAAAMGHEIWREDRLIHREIYDEDA